MVDSQRLLILTPIKDAAHHADTYFAGLERLTYPGNLISVGLLEGDSQDDTAEVFPRRLAGAGGRFRRTGFWKQDFGFQIPAAVPRYATPFQVQRRCTLAKARNHLLQ